MTFLGDATAAGHIGKIFRRAGQAVFAGRSGRGTATDHDSGRGTEDGIARTADAGDRWNAEVARNFIVDRNHHRFRGLELTRRRQRTRLFPLERGLHLGPLGHLRLKVGDGALPAQRVVPATSGRASLLASAQSGAGTEAKLVVAGNVLVDDRFAAFPVRKRYVI